MTKQPQSYAPDVYGLVGDEVNMYLLDEGENGLTIIDTGLPSYTRRILQLIRDMGRSPLEVRNILITHADVDHVGGLRSLVDATAARVFASAASAEYIRKRQSPPHIRFPMNMVVGAINRMTRQPVEVDTIVSDGDVLDIAGGIRVLATPGHTDDHVSYYWEREKVLFAGDLLRNINELAISSRSTWSAEKAQESTRRVVKLDPKIIGPGHGFVWRADYAPEQLAYLKTSLNSL